MGTAELTRVLDEAGVSYELIPHRPTETADDEAEALGLSAGEVAKTLVVKMPAGYVRVLLPASERIDLRKVRDALGDSKDVRLATEDDLSRDYPDFELGAVPPVGGARADPVLVDARLAGRVSLVFEAGTHDESVRVPTGDLLAVARAQVADICRD